MMHPIIEALKRSSSLDLRSLALFRVAVGLVSLLNLALRLFSLRAFHSSEGPWPPLEALSHGSWASLTWCFHATNTSVGFQFVLFMFHAVVALFFTVGLRTRVTSVLLYLWTISLNNSNRLVLSGGDELLEITLFWMMFLPVGACHSADAATAPDGGEGRPAADGLRSPPNTSSRFSYWSLATLGWTVNVSLVYWFAALWKSSPVWNAGSAVFYALNIGEMASSLAPLMFPFRRTLIAMSWFSIYWEAAGPMVYWLPWQAPWLRVLAVAAFLGMHAGFGLFLHIGLFAVVPMACHVSFLPGELWDWLDKIWFSRPGNKVRHQSIVFVRGGNGGHQQLPMASLLTKMFASLFLSPVTRVLFAPRLSVVQHVGEIVGPPGGHGGTGAARRLAAVGGKGDIRRRVGAGPPSTSPLATATATDSLSPDDMDASSAHVFKGLDATARDRAMASCSDDRMRGVGADVCVALWSSRGQVTVYYGGDAWPCLIGLSPVLWPLKWCPLVGNLWPAVERRLQSVVFALLADSLRLVLPEAAFSVKAQRPRSRDDPDNKSPDEQRRYSMLRTLVTVLRSLAVLFFTLYVIVWNVSGFAKVPLPPLVNWIGPAFRIQQFWGMFSPGPAPYTQWPLVTGTLRNGTQVDLFDGGDIAHSVIRPVPSRYRSQRPAKLTELFYSHRWQKALMNLMRLQQGWSVNAYLKYACKRWNVDGVAGDAARASVAAAERLRAEPHFWIHLEKQANEAAALASSVQLISVQFEIAHQATPDPFAFPTFVEAAAKARTGPVALRGSQIHYCYGDGGAAQQQSLPHQSSPHFSNQNHDNEQQQQHQDQQQLQKTRKQAISGVFSQVPAVDPDDSLVVEDHYSAPGPPLCKGEIEFYIPSFSEQVDGWHPDGDEALELKSAARSRVCDREFRVIVWPKGQTGTETRASVFLDASEDLESKPNTRCIMASFDLTVVNSLHPDLSVVAHQRKAKPFCKQSSPSWGFSRLVDLKVLADPNAGFLINDVATVRIKIKIFPS